MAPGEGASSLNNWPNSYGIDYRDVLRRRLLHLMNPDEIAELAARGVGAEIPFPSSPDTPEDQDNSVGRVKQNRCRIAEWTGGSHTITSVFRAVVWHPQSTAVATAVGHTERCDLPAHFTYTSHGSTAPAARDRSFGTGPC